jgi:hypothetical protein
MSLYALAAGLALLVVLLYLAHGITRMPAGDLARALRTFGAVFAGLAGVGLLLAGRWGLGAALLLATAAATRALWTQGRGATSMGDAPDDGQTSTVETETLRMTLDHATGELDGEVIGGPHRGRALSALGLSDLLQVLMHCRIEDPGSVALLETYLDRREPGWREASWDGHAGGGGGGRGGEPEMDEARALEVLGLRPGASEEEIRQAHRRLMARFHPDAGGSNYLASEINRAKDFLLKRRR